MKRILAVVICFMLCISVAGCANGSSGNEDVNGGKASGTIGFESVENDPNNMLMGGKVAFNEDYIFYSDNDIDDKVCRVEYDGTDKKVITSEGGRYLNLYNGYLYYMAGSGYRGCKINRVNLTTLEEEIVIDISYGKDSDYAGYIGAMIIVNDYLFYTVENGNKWRIESNRGMHAHNLITGEEKVIQEDVEYFTFDDENLYCMYSGGVDKLSFDDIKNKPENELKFEEIDTIRYDDVDSSMLSKYGVCYKNIYTDDYEYYDYKTGEVKVLLEDSQRVYDKNYLSEVIPVGDSVISYVNQYNTLSLFKKANLKEAPVEIFNEVDGGCFGVYKGKLYIIDDDIDEYIYDIDAEGNISKTIID